jgi:hypothetical protein
MLSKTCQKDTGTWLSMTKEALLVAFETRTMNWKLQLCPKVTEKGMT